MSAHTLWQSSEGEKARRDSGAMSIDRPLMTRSKASAASIPPSAESADVDVDVDEDDDGYLDEVGALSEAGK